MANSLLKILLAGVSSIALVSAAGAADMGMPMKAPAPALPVASWQGFYIGINGGAARLNTVQSHNIGVSDGVCGDGSVTCAADANGGMFGGQIGYNWQSRYLVYGIEADGDWTGLKHDVPLTSNGTADTRAQMNWLASVRGRMGLAVDDTLIYVTGGAAFAGTKSGWGGGYTGTTGCCVAQTGVRAGWVAGMGAEHMLTPNLLFRGEFPYYGLGSQTISDNVALGTQTEVAQEVFVGRLGLSYKW